MRVFSKIGLVLGMTVAIGVLSILLFWEREQDVAPIIEGLPAVSRPNPFKPNVVPLGTSSPRVEPTSPSQNITPIEPTRIIETIPGESLRETILRILSEHDALSRKFGPVTPQTPQMIQQRSLLMDKLRSLLDQLVALGSESIPIFLDILEKESLERQYRFIIEAMSKIGGPDVTKGFSGMLTNPDVVTKVKVTIVRKWGNAKDEGIREILLGLLESETDPKIQLPLVRQLSHSESMDVSKFLSRFVDTAADTNVRIEAIHAIGRLKDPASISPLEGLLREEESIEVKRAAIRAYGMIHGERAVPLLEEIIHSGEDPRLQLKAIHELYIVGGDEARRVLTQLKDGGGTETIRIKAQMSLKMLERREKLGSKIPMIPRRR